MSAVDEEDKIVLHGKNRNWTLREYIDAKCKWREADERGDEEEAMRILLEIPADPDFVMAQKKLFGKEAVLEMGWDLTEANLKFGEGWLDE